ncbi:hypothetical protein [uncultured Sulfitobacter sp.]|uniref:hypothetical protein n=1 Tax=uncultured Sulfitobacter sp. TaxID=191468 RepID=UPI00260B1F29|nr:hypothetical protein [uncultured Sulfitobacter sp.]
MTIPFASRPIGSDDFVARMTNDMTTTGWHFHKAHDATIDKYQVLGERGCGTNIVRKSMQTSLKIMRTEALGWKHSFPFMVAIPPSFLVVCAVRNASDWARSFYKRPWHSNPRLQALDFPTFIRTPWESIVDKVGFFEHINPDLDYAEQEIQWERHPITGERFENIFAMRNLKHRALLSMRARGASVAYVRLDAFNANPEGFLADLAAEFSLMPTKHGYSPEKRRMGNNWKKSTAHRAPLPETWSKEDGDWMNSQLDHDLEEILGFGRNAQPRP